MLQRFIESCTIKRECDDNMIRSKIKSAPYNECRNTGKSAY